MANATATIVPTGEPRSRLLAVAARVLRGLLLVAVALWPMAVAELVIEFLGVAPPRAEPFSVWTRHDDAGLQDEGGSFRPSDDWLWEPRPGATFDGDVINDDACRGPRVPREKGRALRIAAFGDSSTFGMHVREQQCFVRLVETKLRSRGIDAEVINFGCIGYSARQAFERWKGQGRGFDPDVVLVAVGAVNEHWPAQLSDSEKLVLLRTNTRRVRSALERFSAWRWLDGVLAPEARRSLTALPGRAPARVPLDEFERILVEWDGLAQEAGSRFVVIHPPRRVDAEKQLPKLLDYSRALEKTVAAHGLTAIDVYGAIRQLDLADKERGIAPADSPRFVDGFHPSAAGHEIYADLVVDGLIAAGITQPRSGAEAQR